MYFYGFSKTLFHTRVLPKWHIFILSKWAIFALGSPQLGLSRDLKRKNEPLSSIWYHVIILWAKMAHFKEKINGPFWLVIIFLTIIFFRSVQKGNWMVRTVFANSRSRSRSSSSYWSMSFEWVQSCKRSRIFEKVTRSTPKTTPSRSQSSRTPHMSGIFTFFDDFFFVNTIILARN